MNQNKAFLRALALLAHPLSLGAVILLLINDHLLRLWWPSWLTGKLGDLAWLYVMPLALAALLALLLPRRWQRQEQWVGGLAFGLVGVIFVLAKTAPAGQRLVARLAESLFGFPVRITPDPTDLIALVALALGIWQWYRPGVTLRPHLRGSIVLPLVALLTMANMAAPDDGITCLFDGEEGVVAVSHYRSYTSADGGLSWQDEAASYGSCPPAAELQVVPDPLNPDHQYRYTPGVAIEESNDGGQTWQAVYNLVPPSQAEKLYYEHQQPTLVNFQSGPLAGLVDARTGNVIFAMGVEGVVAGTPEGQWSRVPVGIYRRPELDGLDDALWLLRGELLLAASLGLLLLSAAGLFFRRHWFRLVLFGLAVALWLAAIVVFPPALLIGYGAFFTITLVPAVGILAMGLAVEAGLRLGRRSPAAFLRLVGLAALAAVFFLLPYLLWAFSTLPDYFLAVGFALFLGAVTAFLVIRWARGAFLPIASDREVVIQ